MKLIKVLPVLLSVAIITVTEKVSANELLQIFSDGTTVTAKIDSTALTVTSAGVDAWTIDVFGAGHQFDNATVNHIFQWTDANNASLANQVTISANSLLFQTDVTPVGFPFPAGLSFNIGLDTLVPDGPSETPIFLKIFDNADPNAPTRDVPDSGASAGLFALSLAGLGLLRRLLKRASATRCWSFIAVAVVGFCQFNFSARATSFQITPDIDTATQLSVSIFLDSGTGEVDFTAPVNFKGLDQNLIIAGNPVHNPGTLSINESGGQVRVVGFTFAHIFISELYAVDPVGTSYAARSGSYISQYDNTSTVNWNIGGMQWIDDQGTPALIGNISLTIEPASTDVPDVTSTLPLLGLALAGLAGLKRR